MEGRCAGSWALSCNVHLRITENAKAFTRQSQYSPLRRTHPKIRIFAVRHHLLWLIGVGSNSILGEGECNIHCDTAICAACMNINTVSRVKYWGALAPLAPLALLVPTPMHYKWGSAKEKKRGINISHWNKSVYNIILDLGYHSYVTKAIAVTWWVMWNITLIWWYWYVNNITS